LAVTSNRAAKRGAHRVSIHDTRQPDSRECVFMRIAATASRLAICLEWQQCRICTEFIDQGKIARRIVRPLRGCLCSGRYTSAGIVTGRKKMLQHLARAARSFQDFGSWIAYKTMNRTAKLRPGGCWHRDALALLCYLGKSVAVMQEPIESEFLANEISGLPQSAKMGSTIRKISRVHPRIYL